MPGIHARLSPSSAERWLACPGSVLLSTKVPADFDEGSVYARQGTAAHALAELKARFRLLKAGSHTDYLQAYADWQEEYGYADEAPDADELRDLHRHATGYVELLRKLRADDPGSSLFLEERLSTGVAEIWGTSDAVIVSARRATVIDYKYGQGVAVSAVENPQLMLYACGVLEEFDLLGTIEEITLVVHQPRIGEDGLTTEYVLSAEELRRWRDETVAPTAARALEPGAEFVPGESQCRWCPAAGICSARTAQVLAEDFGADPEMLSVEELGEILPRLSGIRSWAAAVEKAAFALAYRDEVEIPGYKVVLRGGRRFVREPEAMIQKLIDDGFSAEEVAEFKVRPFGHLEKLLGGRAEFDRTVGSYVSKSEPSPVLVTDDSPGEPINRSNEAARDFAGEG